MKQIDNYFFNCSKEYVDSICPDLANKIICLIKNLPNRDTQAELNNDFWINLTKEGWSFDSAPYKVCSEKQINNRSLCLTSTTLDAGWHSDFAKQFDHGLVQIEVQFGKVEAMFKDFCGFKIAHFERRLSLGIEIVMSNPNSYFAHRKSAISGMAYFDIAKRALPAIELGCPIWLIGIN